MIDFMRQVRNKIRVLIKSIKKEYRFILRNPDITIISNNCIAGMLYQDFGMRYNSPTVGLQIPETDFVKLCYDFDHYMKQPIVESLDIEQEIFSKLGGSTIDFPVGKLDDLTIFFQHYKNIDESVNKWNDRMSRINKDKLFFIFVAGEWTDLDVIEDFLKICHPNILVMLPTKKINNPLAFTMNNGNEPWFGNIGESRVKYYQQYDFVSWIYNNLTKKYK